MLQDFIQFRDLLQIYHWQTKSYARHVAAGQLYDKFQINLDRIIEAYTKNNKRITINTSVKLYNVSDSEMEKILEEFVRFLASLKFPKRSDLENIRDEILSDVNQTLYLFTFQ